MPDESQKKIEEAKKCLAVLSKLRQQMSSLKALDLSGDENRYLEASFAHISRIQTCFNNLFFKIQDSLVVKAKRVESHKITRSIKQ
jgi:hypothetical protein